MRVLVGLTLVALGGCREPEPSDVTRVSGHVEATEVQIASTVGGRIVEMRPAEGDRLAAGDVVARIDTEDTELQIQRARAERNAADAQLRLLLAGADPDDIRQAEAQAQAARAEVAASGAELKAAETDLRRFEALLEASAGSQKQRDDARARVDVAREGVKAAEQRVQAADAVVSRLKGGPRREEVDALRARVATVDAQIAALEKTLKDAVVAAPSAGVVTERLVETGEIAAPGMPLLVIADLDHAWANLFVPEPLIPRVMLGQSATVFTDAGGPGLEGKVTYVSPQAEFTPRNVQTPDERSKLVYRIKVSVDNSAGVLKQGMPVDAELRLQ
jgi:HlyD family secretion protein